MHGVVRIRELGGRIDELTTPEIGRVEPDIQHVEEGQQLLLRIVARQLLNGRRPGLHFPFVTLPNRGNQQIAFAIEVLVERRLRHTGRVENPVDAHRLKAVTVKQLDGNMNQPRSPPRGGIGKPEQFDDRLVLAVENHAAILSFVTSPRIPEGAVCLLNPVARGPFSL